MNKFQLVEKILNNYKTIEVQINNLKIELNNSDLDGIEAIDYGRDKLSNSYKISSLVENLIFKDNKEKDLIEKELHYLEYVKEKTDNAMKLLNDRDCKIIKLRYINKVPSVSIARDLCISEAGISKIKKKAIAKMSKLF